MLPELVDIYVPAPLSEDAKQAVKWLDVHYPKLTEFYLAAHKLAHGSAEMPEGPKILLLAHLLREIRTYLMSSLRDKAEKYRVNYPKCFDMLGKSYDDYLLSNGGLGPQEEDYPWMGLPEKREVFITLEQHRASYTRREELERVFYGQHLGEGYNVGLGHSSNVLKLLRSNDLIEKNRHLQTDKFAGFDELVGEFDLLTLQIAALRPKESLDFWEKHLEPILADANSSADVEPSKVQAALSSLANHNTAREEFYQRLNNHNWLAVLQGLGVFQHPPKEINCGKNGFRYQRWPELGFLKKVCPHQQDVAFQALNDILSADIGKNYLVLSTVVEILPLLTQENAGRVWGIIKLRQDFPDIVRVAGDKLVDLALFFEDTSKRNSVLKDAIILLNKQERGGWYSDLEPALGSSWSLNRALNRFIENVSAQAGMSALHPLCEKLHEIIKGEPSSDEASVIWRPEIGSNKDDSVRNVLVTSIRKLSVKLIRSGKVECVKNALLNRYKSITSYRLMVDLYASEDIEELDSFVSGLVESGDFSDRNLHPEICCLLRQKFASLAENTKKNILVAITTDEEELRQYEKMESIEQYLSGGHLTTYQTLKQMFGPGTDWAEAEARYLKGLITHKSPLSSDEIAEHQVEELIGFIESWKPKEVRYLEQDTAAFAKLVAKDFVDRPEYYFDVLKQLQKLPSMFLRDILYAIREKELTPSSKEAWELFMSEFKACMAKPQEVGLGQAWLRAVYAILSKVPTEYLGTLQVVLSDALHKSLGAEVGITGNVDLYGKAVNSNQGVVLEILISLAQRLATEEGDNSECKKLIETACLSKDPLAIATLGRYMPWIRQIDKKWFEEFLPNLLDIKASDTFQNAWVAYILYTNPYDDIWPSLEKYYLHALQNPNNGDKSYIRRLAEHIIVLYVRGVIPLEHDTIQLLRKQQFIGHTLQWLGGLVSGKAAQDEHLERAQRFWELAVEAIDKKSSEYKEEVFSQFSKWLPSPLDASWLLDNLNMIIDSDVAIDCSYSFIHGIKRLLPERPVRTTELLIQVLEKQRLEEVDFLTEDNVRVILELAIEHLQAKEGGENLLNRLKAELYKLGHKWVRQY